MAATGMVTDTSELQQAKAPFAMAVTELGMVTDTSELHPKKANCPISVVPSATMACEREPHPGTPSLSVPWTFDPGSRASPLQIL
jgi:hypothetical protein